MIPPNGLLPGQARFRMPVETGLFAHKAVDQLVFAARILPQLQVTHEHDGGRLTRHHLITAVGSEAAVRALVELMEHWKLLCNGG